MFIYLDRMIDFQYNKIEVVEPEAFTGSPPIENTYLRSNKFAGNNFTALVPLL